MLAIAKTSAPQSPMVITAAVCCEFEDNPTSSSRSAAFSHCRKAAMLACALRSSSSQKSHSVAIFGSPVYCSRQRRFSSPHDNSGHAIIEIVRLHLSCMRQSIAKWGCAAENCDFPCASYYFNNQLRVPKSQFWLSALNLPKTFGFPEKG